MPPPPISLFVCYNYLENWKKSGHMESDAQIPRGGKNNKDIIESDDPIENFKKDDESRKRWERRFEIFVPDPFQ